MPAIPPGSQPPRRLRRPGGSLRTRFPPRWSMPSRPVPASTAAPTRGADLLRLLLATARGMRPAVLLRSPPMLLLSLTTLGSAALFVAAPTPIAFCMALLMMVSLALTKGAEAMSDAPAAARASSLRATRNCLTARRIADGSETPGPAHALRPGQRVRVGCGEWIPADGRVIKGCATLVESPISTASPPRERRVDCASSGVYAGARVLFGAIVVEVSSNPGCNTLDRGIALAESGQRPSTPCLTWSNAITGGITCLATAVMTLLALSAAAGRLPTTIGLWLGLAACLAPITLCALPAASGIAGKLRFARSHVIAKSGRALQASGCVDTLLLDKSGLVTTANRKAIHLHPLRGVDHARCSDAARLACLRDHTPEGRSTLRLACEQGSRSIPQSGTGRVIPFSPVDCISGVDIDDGHSIRKGAPGAIRKYVRSCGGCFPEQATRIVERAASKGETALVLAQDGNVLGIITLEARIGPGVRERLARLRRAGVHTIMVTRDHPLTAAAIAKRAGVDEYVADATTDAKTNLVRAHQARGRVVAMVGDASHEAPALVLADVGLAKHSSSAAAREAANLIDLESNPDRIFEIIDRGYQLRLKHRALTMFAAATELAKWLVLLPAILATQFPVLGHFDLLQPPHPVTVVLSILLFNILALPALVVLAARDIHYQQSGPAAMLINTLLVYDLGGLLLALGAIKLFHSLWVAVA